MNGKKGSWIVKIECIVEKEVICDDCTEEEARTNPFNFAIQETEKGQKDWSVESVEPNT